MAWHPNHFDCDCSSHFETQQHFNQIEEMMRWADKDGDGLVSKKKAFYRCKNISFVENAH